MTEPYRFPTYRPVYDNDLDGWIPGIFNIECACCGMYNGAVALAYGDGRVIGVTVELDRRLVERGRHEATGLPRYGPSNRLQKGKTPRLRRAPDRFGRIAESYSAVTTATGVLGPNRLWLHCWDCNAGHLADPMTTLVPSL